MGRLFEETDASGDTVWMKDGFEVFAEGEKFKVRDSARGLDAWVPGRYDTVEAAFIAANLLKEMTLHGDANSAGNDQQ